MEKQNINRYEIMCLFQEKEKPKKEELIKKIQQLVSSKLEIKNMKNPESEQELKEEKTGDNLNQEEKAKEDTIETESKSSKKNSFKPRKLKRPLARVVKKNNYFVRNNITYIDYKDTKSLSL